MAFRHGAVHPSEKIANSEKVSGGFFFKRQSTKILSFNRFKNSIYIKLRKIF